MYSWNHTVVKNAHVIERRELDQTPGWAVALHFIPIALLFKPYNAVKHFAASEPANLRQAARPMVGIVAGLPFLINLLSAIGFTLGAAACVLGWIFITRISQRQRELGGFTP